MAVYATRTYLERRGRPERLEDVDRHAIVALGADIALMQVAKWLQRVAPNATVAACSDTVLGLVMAAKSGAGLAILPVQLGDREDTLVRVLDSPELMSHIYLLVHATLQHRPRVRAFIGFLFEEIATLRPLLRGEFHSGG